MNKYNFDKINERRNTNSIKFDFAAERGKPEGLYSLWVADMDFETAPEIKEALMERVNHGIYGYSHPKDDYRGTLNQWMKRRHNWDTRAEWYVLTPGVVFALSMAIKAYTEPGDCVVIQRPVYYPFSNTIQENDRKIVNNPLVYSDGKYTMDVEHFESCIVENNVKLFILCNPHNPVGRVWTKEELIKIGDICVKHNVVVVSDEIHEDFIRPGHAHTVFAAIKPEYNEITITCTSPSKSFNLAGLQISNIVIANEEKRAAFQKEIMRTGYDEPTLFGTVACQTAYEKGEQWLEELKVYLEGNIKFLREFLEEKMPKVKLIEPEGTYLVWLDFSAYGLSETSLEDRILHNAGLWLDGGTMLGPEGEGFQRVNIATTRAYLEEALLSLEKGFAGL